MKRPLIGVTGPDAGGRAAWWFTRFALWRAGAAARRITPSRPCGGEDLDGLVIGGGADVDPALYGESAPSMAEAMAADDPRQRDWGRRLVVLVALVLRRLLARKVRAADGDPGRDELERRLIDEALRADTPILGICRGAQLLNVCCGGTLHRDLAAFYEETPQIVTVRPKKRIEVEPGSLLAEILGAESCRVNALHRQAVDRLAEGLRVAAREATGLVQAIEHPGRRFVLGVQWHPEYLPQIARQRRIFARLADAARRPSTPPILEPGS